MKDKIIAMGPLVFDGRPAPVGRMIGADASDPCVVAVELGPVVETFPVPTQAELVERMDRELAAALVGDPYVGTTNGEGPSWANDAHGAMSIANLEKAIAYIEGVRAGGLKKQCGARSLRGEAA